ncbi:ABC transporter permease [Arsukibacterium sp.]|uniref:ABC transporter permease n=1 Tax=Arsukibacterium sp. TaxID=1977258 RepID=UPI002FD8AE14
MWANIAWRLFWQELKRGELWVIGFALFLSVTAVVSLSGITEGVRDALAQRSAQFIAADRVLRSGQAFDQAIIALAEQQQLQQARQIQFNSMLFGQQQMQLVTVKAVSESYPLRGTLLLQRSALRTEGEAVQLKAGQVFLEQRLFGLLDVTVGSMIELGEMQFEVGGIIVNEPDAPLNVFGGSPRVIMHLDDVAATGVIQPGSRLDYRYLFAGTPAALSSFEQAIEPMLTPQLRWQSFDRESAVGSALDRAEQFLLLSGLLGIILAACAAAVAASRYRQRHTQAVAVIKALGASVAMTRLVYGSHLLLVLLASLMLGVLVGALTIQASQYGIGLFIDDYQANFSWRPYGLGVLTSVICGVFFVARPLWRLAATPAIEVLKQPAVEGRIDVLQAVSGALTIWALMWLFSGEFVISLVLFVVCALFAGLLMGAAALLVKLGKPLAAGQSTASRLALANLRRRLWPNSFQLITFSLAIFLTLLLYFLRAELIGQWRDQVPEGSPNQFLVNISAEQKPALQQFAADQQLALDSFYPVVRGRLININNEHLADEATKDDRSEQRVGVGRELNLTWLTALPPNNNIVAGQWFDAQLQAEVSVEQELAERLALSLGDKLTFSVGGQQLDATVSSIREVDWNSLQPNFYMILSPDLLAGFPATYISAFYLPAEQEAVLNQLARRFPTITVLSVDQIIAQVNDIIAQVTVALSYILILIGLSAALVLIAQVQATLEQRQTELAILRTLGARYAFLRNALLLEFALLGLMAGVFATVLAELLLLSLQQRVFNLPFSFHYALWWLGPVIGVLVVSLLGWWQLRRLLQLPGATLIRRVLQN